MEVKKENIGSGDKAIFSTVDKMIELVKSNYNHANIRKISSEIFDKTDGNQIKMAVETFNYVLNNIKYKFDHENVLNYVEKAELKNPDNTEFIISPKYLADPDESEIRNEGDCDDMTVLFCTIAKALGLRTRMRIIAWKSNAYSHVYPEVGLNVPKIGWRWIPADPVIKKFGIEKAPIIRAKSFEVS